MTVKGVSRCMSSDGLVNVGGTHVTGDFNIVALLAKRSFWKEIATLNLTCILSNN